MKTVASCEKEYQRFARYLLGELPETEQGEVEELYMLQGEYAELLARVETDLAECYAYGTLTRNQKEHFETHFLVTRKRREILQVAQALKLHREEYAHPSTWTFAAWKMPAQRFFLSNWPQAVAAGFTMLAVGVSSWFLLAHREATNPASKAANNTAMVAKENASVPDTALPQAAIPGPVETARSLEKIVPTPKRRPKAPAPLNDSEKAAISKPPEPPPVPETPPAQMAENQAPPAIISGEKPPDTVTKPATVPSLLSAAHQERLVVAIPPFINKSKDARIGEDLRQMLIGKMHYSDKVAPLRTPANGNGPNDVTLADAVVVADVLAVQPTRGELPHATSSKVTVTIDLKLVDSRTGRTLVSTSVEGEAIFHQQPMTKKLPGFSIGAVDPGMQSADSAQRSTDTAMAEAVTKAFQWIEEQSRNIPQKPKANVRTLPLERMVSLGMTMESVTAAFGLPKRIVDLGPKIIYVYRDLKITFKNGKVSDVQ